MSLSSRHALLRAVGLTLATPILVHAGDPPIAPRGSADYVQANVNSLGQNIPGDAANEPSICVDPTRPNRMAIGWRQFDTIASNFREAGWAYSRDAGRSWTFPGVLQNGVFRSDPVLRSTRDGVFYYYSLQTLEACHMFKSVDGGKTWSAPTPAYGGDKAWFAIDTTGGPGDGNIYVAWSVYYGCCNDDVLTRSLDDGGTFSVPNPLPAGRECVFGTMDVGPSGELYLIGCNANSFPQGFWVHKSQNAWNSAIPIGFTQSTQPDFGGGMGFTSPSVNPGGLLGQAQVVVDHSGGPRNGWVYGLCSVTIDPNNPAGDPMDVRFCRSTDGGLTWSAAATIGDDPPGVNAWQWFGTISIAPNGRLDVIWNDTRVDVNPRTPQRSVTLYSNSSDGGVTWSAPAALGPSWNHLVGFPQQSKIGDYYDMASDDVGVNVAYATTYNNEQDVWFQRIGDYDCNGNGVADTTDVAGGGSADVNGDGIPDECQCLADVNGDEQVNLTDLAQLLAAFGACAGGTGYNAAADLNLDDCVNLTDLAILLISFGSACP